MYGQVFYKKKKMVINHKKYFQLMPLAFENFNLNKCDIILSSSSSCANGVITKPESIHACYCHTPMRYACKLREDYTEGMRKIKRRLVKILLHYMRIRERALEFDESVFQRRIKDFIEEKYNKKSEFYS